MDRRAAIAVLTGAMVAVLFVAVATAGGVQFSDGAGSFGTSSEIAPVTTIAPVTEAPLGSESAPWELPGFVEVILQVVFYLGVAIFTVLVLLYAWRHRPTFRWSRRRRTPSVDFDALDEVATAITADAEAQRQALRRGTPRNAIVECWLRLEAAVVAAGVPREPADTSTDLTERVLTTRHVDPLAISGLAALYREARFSSHEMNEESRREAIDALDAVHQGLRSSSRKAVSSA